MLEVMVSVCLVLSGVYTTTTIVLLLLYRNYSKNTKTSDEVLKKIADEHNALAQRYLELVDKMQVHEFKLGGSAFGKK